MYKWILATAGRWGLIKFSNALYLFDHEPTMIKHKKGCGVNFPSPHPCGFSNNVFSKDRVKPCFFMTFNIIISHIFPENFSEISEVVQRIWKLSLSIWTIFINFINFLDFLQFAVTKKLITSAYNGPFKHLFTFNIL